jgi:hypothetical protein
MGGATMLTPLRPLTSRKEADVPSLHAETSPSESEWFFINIKFATLGKED